MPLASDAVADICTVFPLIIEPFAGEVMLTTGGVLSACWTCTLYVALPLAEYCAYCEFVAVSVNW